MRSTLTGHFQSCKNEKCTTRRLLLIIFKSISVQDNSSGWGTEGSEGRWAWQACIGRSVTLNYQVYRTDGRTGGRPGVQRRSLVAGVQLRTKTTLLQYYEQFDAVTKYVNTVICNNIAVTYVKSREISQ